PGTICDFDLRSTWRGATEATGLRVGVPRLLVGRLIAIDLSPLENFEEAYCACDNSTSSQPTEKRTAAEQWDKYESAIGGATDGVTLEDIMGPARSVEQTRCEFVEVSAPTLPLVRSTRRFEIHYVHSGSLQCGRGATDTATKHGRLGGSDAEPKQLHALVECSRIVENPVIRRLRSNLLRRIPLRFPARVDARNHGSAEGAN